MQRFRTISDARPGEPSKIKDLAEELYLEILPIWQKANIPTLDQKTCVSPLGGGIVVERWWRVVKRKQIILLG